MNIAYDKKLHFFAGVIVCMVVALIFKNPMFGLIASVTAGIAKEFYDWCDYGKLDLTDTLATWVGGVAGYIVCLLIHTL